MKKKVSIILSLVFIVIFIFQLSVIASDISLFNNNVGTTNSSFSISSVGEACVVVDYMGYKDVTTGATINITIEKRNLLFFWNDVITETITCDNYHYTNEFYYQLEDSGTYRCTVEYVISGTGGADDVITFEDTASY